MRNSIVAELQSHQWAMEPAALKAFFERLAGLPADASLPMIAVAPKPKELNIVDGVAVIPISGVLLKSVPGWMRLWGLIATGQDEIQAQIKAALANKLVTRIHMQIDSPGGQVAGGVETADAILNARASKSVTATIEDLGASGAYWLASAAETIDASSRNTMVGSIGVFSVYYDFSKFDEAIGVKVIVIRSGEHKGMGIDGVTDNQIAAIQEIIDAMADNFVDAVAAGRGKPADDIRELATGQLWIAAAARELGLIDTVTDERKQASKQSSEVKGETVMDKDENSRKAVEVEKIKADTQRAAQNDERIRASQLKTEFADDPEFAIKAVTEGWSVAEAKAEYCGVLRARVAEQAKEIESGKIKTDASGAAPIGSEDTDGAGDGDFLAEAREMAETKKISVTAAMKKLRRMKPALHEAFKARCQTDGHAMYRDAV